MGLTRRWNWGAFLLPWLWPFWHGVPWIGIVTLLCVMLSQLSIAERLEFVSEGSVHITHSFPSVDFYALVNG